MSTKRMNEAIAALKATAHRSNDDGLWNLGLAAEEELRAMERAAKVIALQGVFEHPDDDADCLRGIHFAEEVMESIAKDAP